MIILFVRMAKEKTIDESESIAKNLKNRLQVEKDIDVVNIFLDMMPDR